tara:strand:+ start:413 stop:559 length:147 start_codon:yes stop_codon:yes gene_type:complete
MEEELEVEDTRRKILKKNKTKRKGYVKNEEDKKHKKNGKIWSNHPDRI